MVIRIRLHAEYTKKYPRNEAEIALPWWVRIENNIGWQKIKAFQNGFSPFAYDISIYRIHKKRVLPRPGHETEIRLIYLYYSVAAPSSYRIIWAGLAFVFYNFNEDQR